MINRINTNNMPNVLQVQNASTLPRDEEGALLNCQGIITKFILPGQSIPALCSSKLILYREKIQKYLYFPVGIGNLVDANERILSCCVNVSCKLVSIRHFALKSGKNIVDGCTTEQILQQELREALKTCLLSTGRTHCNDSEFWNQAKDAVQVLLLQNGWQLIDFEPVKCRR